MKIEKPLRLALASIISPVVAGGIGAMLLTLMVVPDLILRENSHLTDDTASGWETRAATFYESIENLLGMGAFGATIGAIAGIPGVLIFGLLAHRWLMQRARHGLLPYLFAGLIAGTVTSFIFFGLDGGARDVVRLTPLHLAGPIAGPLTALFFWLIRRPDKDARLPVAA